MMPITNTITIGDLDDTDIESAVIQITGNYANGEDVLAFTNTGTITGVWDAVTGTMTLTGSDTLANYEAALRSVTYENTSDDPSALTRTVSFTVNDGDVDGNVVPASVVITTSSPISTQRCSNRLRCRNRQSPKEGVAVHCCQKRCSSKSSPITGDERIQA